MSLTCFKINCVGIEDKQTYGEKELEWVKNTETTCSQFFPGKNILIKKLICLRDYSDYSFNYESG